MKKTDGFVYADGILDPPITRLYVPEALEAVIKPFLNSSPGDSIRDHFIPLVGGHQQPLKGSLNHPKQVTKNCRAP